ncbi:ABC transporter permease subunit [Pullulanibacillus sp. KACC 23026]|uniref:carbohydrate ABC transporter permease n=1 Tax=Pullulanibacillus sp. KACC 23026 TaxID=3028315 RepID=UPI0023AFA51C|nr:ABC transporter permease subunit [Pullulanibacillus sp. KACC 23026]WEG13048.1 ABC transporter permease subunit [Pullulanibacillus sp. KACC 23026]
MKRQKGNRRKSDWKAAYLLMAPALILILVIAVYPVLQSMYFSLFDYKLNDPTQSKTTTHYSIDLQRYLNDMPFLMGDIQNDLPKVTGKDHDVFNKVSNQLTAIDNKIKKETGSRYTKVNTILNNFKTPSDELSQVRISKSTAVALQQTANQVEKELAPYQDSKVLTNAKKDYGLATGLGDALIKPNFIGLQHYKTYLQDPRMWAALLHTVTFTIISVFIEFVLGLAIALLINKAFFGRGLIRATVLVPWAVPTAISAMMWRYLYDGQSGIIAKFFQKIGIIHDMGTLLTTTNGAMSSVILADVWKTTPYMALLLLAGLQVIPESLYEAAAIDGANKWKQFVRITLPLLKTSILVALLFRTLDAFRVFDLIYVLTGGGPANSTETISIYAYKVMFSQTDFGGGSALSVIVFFCVAIISIIFVKLLGSELLPEGSKN